MKIREALLMMMIMVMALWAVAECAAEEEKQRKTYIVHMSEHHMRLAGHTDHHRWHAEVLARVTEALQPKNSSSTSSSSRLVYSYGAAMSGFTAELSEDELALVRAEDGFLAAYPDTRRPLQTTYTYTFLGLDGHQASSLWNRTGAGQDAIIAVLDTGVWPESPSFSGDAGLPPVPRRWRGTCQSGPDFNSSVHCNRKLIGARFFNSGHQASAGTTADSPEYDSPRDARGHGTHTASTAAGSTVHGAGLLGNAQGTAQGMAPRARVAVYKVCWDGGCFSSDILAGMDAAIADGADVISLSIGGFSAPFSQDAVAIGAFRAAQHGVFVACAAGNNGPFPRSVANEAPWITTVGASTVDRKFLSAVHLAGAGTLRGETLHPAGAHTPLLPLVYAGDAGVRNDSRYCLAGALVPERVRGKIVLCDRGATARAEKGDVVRRAGGLAMVLADDELNGEDTAADAHVLPASQIGFRESQSLKSYIAAAPAPRASISFAGTVFGLTPAPAVASFSSRGPSVNSPGILKPDIVAPGVNILAAWPQNLAPSGLSTDPRRTEFNVVSGTSMACPHIAGVAALIKCLRPEFSPAAIKSALMTTADSVNTTGGLIMDAAKAAPAGVFATGAGHLNPERAADPGLVYDMQMKDFVPYLCWLEYSDAEIQSITGHRVRCQNVTFSEDSYAQLNYPSISANFNLSRPQDLSVRARRTVTNVGSATSAYKARVRAPRGVRVQIRPSLLRFSRVGQRKSFVITMTRKRQGKPSSPASQGWLAWISDDWRHRVRSPIAVTWSDVDSIQV